MLLNGSQVENKTAALPVGHALNSVPAFLLFAHLLLPHRPPCFPNQVVCASGHLHSLYPPPGMLFPELVPLN